MQTSSIVLGLLHVSHLVCLASSGMFAEIFTISIEVHIFSFLCRNDTRTQYEMSLK